VFVKNVVMVPYQPLFLSFRTAITLLAHPVERLVKKNSIVILNSTIRTMITNIFASPPPTTFGVRNNTFATMPARMTDTSTMLDFDHLVGRYGMFPRDVRQRPILLVLISTHFEPDDDK